VDEALTNVIRHGYDNRRDGKIFVRIVTLQNEDGDEGLEIRIRDFGKQVDLVRICGRDLADIRPGGLGVHLIRAMTNTAEYSHAEGGGMVLTMRKFKSHHAAARE
jgi:anti-sigma regulatory factor (Ser/Thr protein kinase)